MKAESPASCTRQLTSLQARLQMCQQQGLDRLDPLRFYYLAGLVQRAADRAQGSQTLRQRLLDKAALLLDEFQKVCEHKQHRDETALADKAALTTPMAALQALNRHLKAQSDGLAPSLDIAESSCDEVNPTLAEAGRPRQELQAVKHYQQLFEKMAVERLLNKVMQEIPENAGPLNPERVVIRCLSALQDISPAYALRLISYYESLICLQNLPLQDK